jgi:hypothetical protein
MSAPMSAIGQSSGLIVLTLSFVDHDPERTCCSEQGKLGDRGFKST